LKHPKTRQKEKIRDKKQKGKGTEREEIEGKGLGGIQIIVGARRETVYGVRETKLSRVNLTVKVNTKGKGGGENY